MDGCVEIIGGSASASGGVMVFDDPGNSSGCGAASNDESADSSLAPSIRPAGQSIYLFMPTSAQVSLRLYDAQGRLVQRLCEGVLASGGHTFNPALEAKGVYMAVMRYQGKTITAKVIR
jgi:hypothetical protein